MSTTSKPATWPELDLLRGFAGVVMVYNHAAAHWVGGSDASGLPGLLFTIGSYAPVLFFAATGLGYGIQAEAKGGRGGHAFGFGRKVAILLLADALMWLSPQTFLGNNFLGFIALTMLLLEPLRSSRRGWWIAAIAAIGIAGLRYVIVPKLLVVPAGTTPTLLHWMAGLGSPPGFAYPPLPWFAYGLVGFSVGVMAQRHREAVLARRRQLIALAGAGALLGLAFVLWRLDRGSTLMRWGSVNGTFFVSGYVMIAGVCALGLALAKVNGSTRWLGLRGTSSLALVPIHYGVIEVFAVALGTTVATTAGYLVAATVGVVVSMVCAKRWPIVVAWLKNARSGWTILVLTTAVCLVIVLVSADLRLRTLSLVVGQLSLCALLVVERPTRAQANA